MYIYIYKCIDVTAKQSRKLYSIDLYRKQILHGLLGIKFKQFFFKRLCHLLIASRVYQLNLPKLFERCLKPRKYFLCHTFKSNVLTSM